MIHVYLWRYACIQKVLNVRTRKGTNIRKFAPHRFIDKRIDDRKKIYTSKNIHVYKAVQSVNTRKGKSICEFAKHRFIDNRIYDVTYVYLWLSACMQRASKCQHSQERKHMGFRTTRVQIQNYQWYNTCILILVNICMYKEVLSVRNRKGHKHT